MRILAQSSGKLMAELLRIISNFIYFLAQGHGCHSLTLHTLSLSLFALLNTGSLSHYVTMLRTHSLAQLVSVYVSVSVVLCSVRVHTLLDLHNTGDWIYCCHSACHCVQLPTGVPGQSVLLLWRPLPTVSVSPVVEFQPV